MALLARDMRISSDSIADILAKHHVCGDVAALQDSYRKRIGQRLMASIRDEDGKRELLASRQKNAGTEYLVINACNDARTLKTIQKRLAASIAGLNRSVVKVRSRTGFLERFMAIPKLKKRKEQQNAAL